MIDATVLFLTFTDQLRWGFSGKTGIDLNCSTDLDDNWYGPMCQVFSSVLRYDIFRGANIGGVCQANREIIEIAESYHPKYVIYPCNFSGIVTEATLAALRRTGCIVVGYFFDEDTYFETRSQWMIPYIDYFISTGDTRGGIIAAYEKLGARCILGLPLPMNPALFCKLADVEKSYEATFMGGLHANRREYLADIASHGADVKYLGGGHGRKVHYSRMVKVYNQSRINLNFTSGQDQSPAARHITSRVFEVVLSGGFLLTEYATGLEGYFDLGREIVCFDTAAEAAEKIQYFLQHPDEREAIAARGYERAHREYTGPVGIRRVFREIEDDLCKRGRPELIPPASGVNPLRKTDAEEYYKWVRALVKSPPPLRDEWRATANLVLATNPEHKAAERLLQRAGKWGDPEPLVGMIRVAAYRVLSKVSGCVAKAEHLSFPAVAGLVKRVIGKIRWAIGSPSRFIRSKIRRWMKTQYGLSPVPPPVLFAVHLVSRIVTWSSSPLFPPTEELDLNVENLSDSDVHLALRHQVFTFWSVSVETLNWVVKHVRETKVGRVLEFGSGLSTIAWVVACRGNFGDQDDGPPYVIAIEENAEYAARTRQLLADLHLDHLAMVVHCPLVDREINGRIVKGYAWDGEGLEYLKSGWRADMLFVDGPSTGDLGRALAIIDGLQWGSDQCVVLLDDALRDDEIRSIHYLQTRKHVAFAGVILIGKGIALGGRCVQSR